METKKISLESCQILASKYLVSCFQTFTGLSLKDRVEQMEKFYKKADHLLDLQISAVIKDLMKGEKIRYKENNREDYQVALFRLKMRNKAIVVRDYPMSQQRIIERECENYNFYNDGEDTIYANVIVELVDV